jgi:hypothetical protein
MSNSNDDDVQLLQKNEKKNRQKDLNDHIT